MNERLLATDEQLTGEVLGRFYADTASGFGVVELLPGDADPREQGTRCSGPLAELTEGQTVSLVGRWRHHPTYGRTFEAVFYEQVAPDSVAGLRAFLGSERFDRVPLIARHRVLTTFGSGAGRVIEHDPARLTAEAGLAPQDADELHRAWVAGLALATLVRVVEPAAWPMDAVRSAHARFGADTVAIARDDPYLLLEAERVRFAHVDALARIVGIGSTDPRRLRAGASAAVAAGRSRDGQQHLDVDACVAATAALLGVDLLVAREGVELAVAAGLLATDRVDGHEVVADPVAFADERGLARDIARLLAAPHPRLRPYAGRLDGRSGGAGQDGDAAPSVDRDASTAGQLAAVRTVFRHPVTVLTGGPGTGKTRAVEEVVRAAEAAGLHVALCAPTGRAAKRIEEMVGRSATTVHRLLEARPLADGGFAFRFGPDEPLPHDLVVVDEVSMCDTRLAGRLVAAVADGAHLLLVGDPDQLPSVGPGDVLREVVRSGVVPVVVLTEIHRQAVGSRIVGLAREVMAGELGVLRAADGDVFLAEEPRRAALVPRVVRAVAERIPAHLGVELDQIQVLAPVYRGPAGVDALNTALKTALNPGGDRPGVGGFHIGDRVMQTRNDPDLDVANGDVGRVVDVDPRGGTLRIAFPRGEVTCSRDQTRHLTPAWAVTVHKAQGGEWPVVVLVVDESHRAMLWRNLLYTAVTRAQRALIVVGQADALRAGARSDRPQVRAAGLAWRLRQLAGPPPVATEEEPRG